jgi:hypothetical protein
MREYMKKDKTIKNFIHIKKDVQRANERHCDLQKKHGNLPVSSEIISEENVSAEKTRDLLDEILSGRLSAVANEIIAEIELSNDD